MFGASSFAASPASKNPTLRDFVFEPDKGLSTAEIAEALQLKEDSVGKRVFSNGEEETRAKKNIGEMFDFIKKGSSKQGKIIFVGNPPYQEEDGGHGASASPIYNRFFNAACSIATEVLFVINPAIK